MSQNMKTLLPNTKFYNFSRKFWQVTALSRTFFWPQGGAEISLGAASPDYPLEPPLTTVQDRHIMPAVDNQ